MKTRYESNGLKSNQEQIILLSYPLGSSTPKYGLLEKGIKTKRCKSIEQGDSCNVFNIDLGNHMGTHLDCPNHFYTEGKKITDYDIADLIFNDPQIIEISLDEGELIEIENLEGKINPQTDFIIINSGWGKNRGIDKYVLNNPGIRSEVAGHIRYNYPNVRAIGFDFISISSFANRDEGRAAHKAFLLPEKEILIVEDMKIPDDIDFAALKSIMIIPLYLEEVDSAPCNVLAFLKA